MVTHPDMQPSTPQAEPPRDRLIVVLDLIEYDIAHEPRGPEHFETSIDNAQTIIAALRARLEAEG